MAAHSNIKIANSLLISATIRMTLVLMRSGTSLLQSTGSSLVMG